MEKGKARWSMIAENIWDMILGKSGKLPGKVDSVFKDMATREGRKFVTTDPQDNYPDDLDVYRAKMAEKGWDLGDDDEELFEYAMHPQQYELYKSGAAKAAFEKDLEERRTAKAAASASLPEKVKVAVHGKVYEVTVSYGDDAPAAGDKPKVAEAAGEGTEVLAPLEGKAYLVQSTSETPKKVGDYVKEGDVICYIEAMKVFNRIKAEMSGTITSIRFNSGDSVAEDDVLMTIK